MAIEFNCPYCTAAIRVPDEFSGKRGSCPKCATKLIVPDVAPQTSGEAGASAVDPAIPVVAPPPATEPVDNTAFTPGVPLPDESPPQFAPSPAATSVSRKLKRKSRRKKSQGLYGLAVPLVCFLLFFAMVGAFTYFRTPDLTGNLNGSVVGEMDIDEASVSLHNLNLPDDQIADVATAFEGATETFISPQMSCSIAVDGDNLKIDVRPGNGFVWYAVNPLANTPLSDWIRSKQTSINAFRLKNMAATGTELCKDKIQKQGGTPIVFDAVRYRDFFGLSTHVDAFGYVVEAIAGNKRSPCAHEDSNGTLYFALPVGTKSFQLRGRDFDGQKLFPGEYTVKVTGAEPATPPPASEEEAALSNPDSDMDEPEGDWDPSKPKSDSEMSDGESMEPAT